MRLRWRRRPRITDESYGKLMTSFGRLADGDPFVWGPATALAERVAGEDPAIVKRVDARLWDGALVYHLRLLAASWVMVADGSVPRATAEVFAEAVAWKLEPLVPGSGRLAARLSERARGDSERKQ